MEMVHPLFIWIELRPLNKGAIKYNYMFECSIPDINNPIMKTGVIFFSEFLLKECRIDVIKIESQISVHD
jgi:hypothetical protein